MLWVSAAAVIRADADRKHQPAYGRSVDTDSTGPHRLTHARHVPHTAFMLLSPFNWYRYFPTRVPETGAFNIHMIGREGMHYLGAAVLQLWASSK